MGVSLKNCSLGPERKSKHRSSLPKVHKLEEEKDDHIVLPDAMERGTGKQGGARNVPSSLLSVGCHFCAVLPDFSLHRILPPSRE